MKTYLDCIPCFVRQALEASKMATGNKIKQEKPQPAVNPLFNTSLS